MHRCTAYKVFTAWFGTEYASLSDYELLTAMEKVAAVDGLMGIHCENSALTDGFEKRLAAAGNFKGSAHEQARPEIAEIEAISRVLLFARHTRCRVLILHLSTPNAWPIIAQARRDGVEVWVETCAHYLTMNTDDLHRLHGFAKCAPPIRSEACRQGLWQMVKDGRIDRLASDHFPFTDDDRLKHGANIFAIPSGMPGFDTLRPKLGRLVAAHRLAASEVRSRPRTAQCVHTDLRVRGSDLGHFVDSRLSPATRDRDDRAPGRGVGHRDMLGAAPGRLRCSTRSSPSTGRASASEPSKPAACLSSSSTSSRRTCVAASSSTASLTSRSVAAVTR